MPYKEPTTWSWISAIAYTALATMGGVLGFLMRSLDKGGPINMYRLVVEGASAGFVGVILMMLCRSFQLSPEWTGVVVGVFGWLGASASIQLIEKLAVAKLGLGTKLPPDKPKE